ncbi:aromatic-L-amino-acid decarboxylase-like protein [Elysia marginata]|uniref:Aromatic-L-amino-acid decarboxylase-like protein n=1 Tax=Elysia marginata TaxID=1093978 RepID=A0AAV4F1T1_9GAST|nr:aromatic-L-amino-acid decarboxylase-like protein [Elysia marginata]
MVARQKKKRTADDSVLVAIIAARARAIQQSGHLTPGQTLDKLVAYTSEEAHTCIKKAANLALVNIRCLPTDEHYSLRGATLAAAIEEDKLLHKAIKSMLMLCRSAKQQTFQIASEIRTNSGAMVQW